MVSAFNNLSQIYYKMNIVLSFVIFLILRLYLTLYKNMCSSKLSYSGEPWKFQVFSQVLLSFSHSTGGQDTKGEDWIGQDTEIEDT